MTRLKTVTRDGQYREVILGQLSIHQNVRQQFLVPSDTYFKADLEVQVWKEISLPYMNLTPQPPGCDIGPGYSLVSCVCVPAFSWSLFTAASVTELHSQFPHLTPLQLQ